MNIQKPFFEQVGEAQRKQKRMTARRRQQEQDDEARATLKRIAAICKLMLCEIQTRNN